MSKVVIVSSSMRKGNSDILCDEFHRGLIESDNIVNRINLREKNIKFCFGCSMCLERGECSTDDDMKALLDIVKEADIIAFATPVYFGDISGQLKVFIDRLYPIYTKLKAKKVIVIASCYQNIKKFIKASIHSIRAFLKDAGNIKLDKIIYGENTDEVGDVSDKQRHLAYMCGKKIK